MPAVAQFALAAGATLAAATRILLVAKAYPRLITDPAAAVWDLGLIGGVFVTQYIWLQAREAVRRIVEGRQPDLYPANIMFASVCGVLGSVLLYVMLVMFGAPLVSQGAETTGAAVHLSLLVFVPLAYALKTNRSAWVRVLTGDVAWPVPHADVVFTAYGALAGAWLGAIPIPLDWDRAWQAWPLTILFGAYFGASCAALASTFIAAGALLGRASPDKIDKAD